MRRLIITCDDCGLAEGINRAAADLHQRGIVTTASIMTNFAAAAHAFRLFEDCPDLGLGVHLNLTDGAALCQDRVPSQVVNRRGRFRTRMNLFTRTLIPYGDFFDVVRAEFVAQIEAFLASGKQPRHLTTHIHFHILPALRELVVDLAREYGIPWVRAYNPRDTSVPLALLDSQKRRERSPEADAHDNVRVPDHLIALRLWMAARPQALLDEVLTLEGNIELVAHPGEHPDSTFPRGVNYRPRWRAAEQRYLEAFYALLQAQAADRVCVGDFEIDAPCL